MASDHPRLVRAGRQFVGEHRPSTGPTGRTMALMSPGCARAVSAPFLHTTTLREKDDPPVAARGVRATPGEWRRERSSVARHRPGELAAGSARRRIARRWPTSEPSSTPSRQTSRIRSWLPFRAHRSKNSYPGAKEAAATVAAPGLLAVVTASRPRFPLLPPGRARTDGSPVVQPRRSQRRSTRSFFS